MKEKKLRDEAKMEIKINQEKEKSKENMRMRDFEDSD